MFTLPNYHTQYLQSGTVFNVNNTAIVNLFKKHIKKTEDQNLMMADYVLVQQRESVKKLKFIFVSNSHIYITKDGTMTRRFALQKINNVVIAGLSGEIALLLDAKDDVIIDSLEYKIRLISILQNACKKDTQFIYVNNTSLQPYLRKDTKTKTVVRPMGKYLVDLRKVEECLPIADRVYGIDKYTINGLISETQNCKIYYVLNNVTNIPFALKSVRKQKYLQQPNLLKKAIASVQFHERIKSKFICRLVEAFYSRTRTYMVMEYLSSYTLARVLTKKGKIKQQFVKVFLAEISAALSIIHDSGFVYNNLRLVHVMLDMEGHIKLIDFSEVQKIGTIKQFPSKPIEYASPQEINKLPLTAQTDWWQLGILSYELMFGYNPFLDGSQQKIKQNIKNREPDIDESSGYSEKALNFIRSLLKKKPQDRLGSKNGFYQILKHQFLDGLKPSVVINRKLDNPYSTKNNRKNVKMNQSFCEDDGKLNQLNEQLQKFLYDARFDD